MNPNPIQYQKGWTEFYKLKFDLTPDVLIPRPETELLVDEVIRIYNEEFRIQKNNSAFYIPHSTFTVIDVGTGSGCIAISIAKNLPAGGQGLPAAKIFAIDISPKALEVALKNAQKNKVYKQIIFIENDLLPNLKISPDVIVANLPYIPTAKLMHIDPMVRDYEPKLALDGGVDGLDLYRKLFDQIRDKNITPKYLVAEIDEDQGETVLKEVKMRFPKALAEIKKDLFKKDRILIIKF